MEALKIVCKNKNIRCIILIIVFCVHSSKGVYNVRRLSGSSRTEINAAPILGIHDIFCYIGAPKHVIHLWKSATLHLDIQTDDFVQYEGVTPDDVWDAYLNDKTLWSGNLFSSQKSRSLSLDPFNSTCMGIKTSQKYTVRLEVINVDRQKVGLLIVGIFLFMNSKTLGENSLFFYLTGISIGICASFMILVYFFSKMLPGKPVIYSAMIGGWTLGIYALQFLWSNFQPLILAYRHHLAWYTLITGFISFIICYKMGPPKDQRSKNLITWTLQAIALALVYFSTECKEAFIYTAVILLILKYMPRGWIFSIKNYWRLKFPKPRKLLTKHEYYEQGIKETAKALEELRGYCSSPECPQWKLMLKLQNPQKFASFVDGNSHVSDDEISDYDNNDFIIRRKNLSTKKHNPAVTTTSKEHNLISDDDSSCSSEEY